MNFSNQNNIEKAHDLRRKICKKNVSVESLLKLKESFFIPAVNSLLEIEHPKEDYIDMIYLLLDYYSFATDGELVSDNTYDLLMRKYISLGGEYIVYPDPIETATTWKLVPHSAPWMVGSVRKVYDIEELGKYFNKWYWANEWIISPKFDGISNVIEVKHGLIVSGSTRYDRTQGFDVTKLIQNAKNAKTFGNRFWEDETMKDGFYKVEVCVSTTDFNELIKEKPYANRRSATSGIMNSPKNIEYAKYLTLIPLAYSTNDKEFIYNPYQSITVDRLKSVSELYNYIEKMLEICRMADYDFRTDGVVVMPKDSGILIDNDDLMFNAMAYKVNTEVGLTKIKRLYLSVGRTGQICPKAEVIPVEVNETLAHDISLGSRANVISLAFHEDEVVEVFAAGHVIPQLRKYGVDMYPKHAPLLKLPDRCPYCNEKISYEGGLMFCRNESCPRIDIGNLTNFIKKLGAMNISDATIEDLYNAKLIKDLPSLFSLDADDITRIDGYGEKSAKMIVDELARIKAQPLPIDKFFGCLGIPNIAEKTAKTIFYVIGTDDLYIKPKKLYIKLLNGNGVGEKTAKTFIKYLEDNIDLIETLTGILNIVDSSLSGQPDWKGNVVFTGFRDGDLESQFNSIGYEVSDSFNSQTIAVISSSYDFSSGKCKKAVKNGVTLIHVDAVDSLLRELKERNK